MKYLLIDGNNLIFRTYHMATHQQKLNDHTDEERNSNHIYYTLNAILSYVRKYKPIHTYITWDERKGTSGNLRKDSVAEYKGNRSKDRDPHQNNDKIKVLLRAVGVQSLYPLNLEADDIIAYIAQEHEGSVGIISVDKDFLQLVNEDTIMYDPIRKIEYNAGNFESLTGYNKADWYTAKCLMGDKSDNVPGLKGFGKVTAQKYLDGLITLNEEQEAQVKINHSVFALDKYNEYPNEKEFYRRQMELSVEGDIKLFAEKCTELGYTRVVNNMSEWNNLFIMNKKLSSLFS